MGKQACPGQWPAGDRSRVPSAPLQPPGHWTSLPPPHFCGLQGCPAPVPSTPHILRDTNALLHAQTCACGATTAARVGSGPMHTEPASDFLAGAGGSRETGHFQRGTKRRNHASQSPHNTHPLLVSQAGVSFGVHECSCPGTAGTWAIRLNTQAASQGIRSRHGQEGEAGGPDWSQEHGGRSKESVGRKQE